jgi:tRNA modification GTPase
MYASDTIVAPATAPGRGAIAIVRLSGPRAIEILSAMFRPLSGSENFNPRELRLGDVIDNATGAVIDRAIGVAMPAPGSFTGEDVAELQIHGGPFLVRRVVGIAMALGARAAEPGEFTRRAFLNGKIDLTAAEAIADLIDASSDRALAHAIAHLSGALAQKISAIRAGVVKVRAHLEVEIDFSDEDIALPSRAEIAGDIDRLKDDVAIVLDSFARGRIAREGVRAAIIGRPNVGKSSILNLMLGAERAIVTPIAGTTRDVIEDSIHAGPHTVVLSDTAGLRDSSDEIERIGVTRTRAVADEADILIAVLDSSCALTDEDMHVIELATRKPAIALMNKADLPAAFSAEQLRARGIGCPILALSALEPASAARLRDEVARAIESHFGDTAGGNDIAIARERHRVALASALQALDSARRACDRAMPPEIIAVDVMAAGDALGQITGEVATEDVLDAIFSQFCIGK